MLRVEGYDKVSKATSHGRLTLVDLAGSERISRSEATGIRLVEAAAINKSLSALGQVGNKWSSGSWWCDREATSKYIYIYFFQVFASIREGALHVPYRNSKLTHILQPCIGGDSKVGVASLSVCTNFACKKVGSGEYLQLIHINQYFPDPPSLPPLSTATWFAHSLLGISNVHLLC